MNEGVFFPNFWTQKQVEHWVNFFIEEPLNRKVQLNFDSLNNQTFFSVDILREIYTEDSSKFNELNEMLRLFGAIVKVKAHQGLFGSFRWSIDTLVVIDPKKINLTDFLVQHPLLNCLRQYLSFTSYDNLFGLVLDQICMINPSISLAELKKLFRNSNVVAVSPLKIASAINPKGIRIDEIFDQNYQKSFIDRFDKAGIVYFSDLTPKDFLNSLKFLG